MSELSKNAVDKAVDTIYAVGEGETSPFQAIRAVDTLLAAATGGLQTVRDQVKECLTMLASGKATVEQVDFDGIAIAMKRAWRESAYESMGVDLSLLHAARTMTAEPAVAYGGV